MAESTTESKQSKSKSSEPNRPSGTSSTTDQARDLSAGHRLSSTEVAPRTKDNEWPVPPNTKNPPNEKVDGKDVTKLDQGLDDFSIEQVDGAKVVLRLGKEARLVDQADLHSAAKKIARGVQVSY